MQTETPHSPVMLREVVAAMQPQDGEIYIDATFGAGGYSRALLEAAECRVLAIDRDREVVLLADALARDFPGRFLLVTGCFGDMVQLLAAQGVEAVDGIVMDLGVSSMQLDRPERGFSFRADGPLDMRMGTRGVPASVLINTLPEADLADLIYRYGEERMARRIAAAIVRERALSPIETSQRLADIVRGIVRGGPTDPATRTFQALRIVVNEELAELERGLAAAARLLKPGGRLIVVTFHSLEDRIVKHFLRPPAATASRHAMAALVEQERAQGNPLFTPLYGRALGPQEDEIRLNPRARSAKLRAGLRTQEPAL